MQFYRRILLLGHLKGKSRVGQENELAPFVLSQEFLLDPQKLLEFRVVRV
jgi:hypothetical protein